MLRKLMNSIAKKKKNPFKDNQKAFLLKSGTRQRWNKTRHSHLSIQYTIEISRHSNSTMKTNPNWEGRGKTITICR